jgi:hypothetical protein
MNQLTKLALPNCAKVSVDGETQVVSFFSTDCQVLKVVDKKLRRNVENQNKLEKLLHL